MPPVTLHQPAEGLDRGDTYSGPNEDWLVSQGYASRAKGEDGLHMTGVEKQVDPTLASNREAPDEDAPQPKTEVRLVDGDAAAFRAPDLAAATDSTQPNQKAVDKMLAEVEDGKRDENAPNVVLADTREALVESRDYDGSPVTEIQKRSQKENDANLKFLGEQTEERRTEALKAVREEQKAEMRGGEQTAPQERQLLSEENRPTGDAVVESTEQEWALLPELGTNVDVGKQLQADVTDQEKVRADLKQESSGDSQPKKAAPKKAAAKAE